MSYLSIALQAADVISKVKETADKSTPTSIEDIIVTVWGGPLATRKNLYRLALAVTWGKIQRRDFIRGLPPPGLLEIQYNLEEKMVRVHCKIITTFTSALVGRLRGRRRWEIFEGPTESTVGGEWSFTSVLPGFVGAPGIDLKNGFETRTLLTPDGGYRAADGSARVSRSPTPPGDKISRGYATIARSPAAILNDPNNWNNRPDYILWAALNPPCGAENLFSPVYPPSPSRPPTIPDPTTTTLDTVPTPSGAPNPYSPPSTDVTTPPTPSPTVPPTGSTGEQPVVPPPAVPAPQYTINPSAPPDGVPESE